MAAIIANAVVLGIQQDMNTRHAMGHSKDLCTACFEAVNHFFVVVFVLEVCFRIFAKRWSFFCGRDWRWNLTDVVLATYSVLEWSLFGEYQPYFQIIRSLRLLRVVRAIRSVRVFRDLRLMICSLSRSLVSLSSALVLLFVVIFLFSICFMHAATTYVEDGGLEARDALQANYGSLSQTMYTLLLAISNGADWHQLAAPLGQIHWFYEMLFSFYVLFVVIGVLNVLTSNFVERARELSHLDRDLATQGELASQEAFLTEMRTVFEEVDDEQDGRITWQKFRDYLASEQAQAFFATQQLDTSDAARLFSLMDVDEAGAVGVEEFTLGCMRLRGPAKSSDVAALLKETKVTRKCVKELRRIGGQLDSMCQHLYIPDTELAGGAAGSSGRSASNRGRSNRHIQDTSFSARQVVV
jgi:hypothetical protein